MNGSTISYNGVKQRIIALFCFWLLSTFLLTGCSIFSSPKAPISRTGFYFDTVISIAIYDSADESILDDCMVIADKYDKLLSAQKKDSDIWNINHSNSIPTTVSPDTISLLSTAIRYAELSDGAFNPALGSVINLWDFNTEGNHIVPNETEVTKALEHTDYKTISIDKDANTVSLSDPEVQIDLGAIAKGFIADQIREYLTEKGVNSAIINLGGNVLLIGTKPDNTMFRVGIEKPFEGVSSYITTIEAADKSIVTSGVYERYFEVDDRIYHHLLNPSTGFPAENNLYSVTILSDSSTDGDALSTTCFVLGLDKGMELIESMDNTEAAFVTNDYKIHYSSGFHSP